MEKMKFKQQSLQELTEIEGLNPPFHIKFIIFRYKFNRSLVLFNN